MTRTRGWEEGEVGSGCEEEADENEEWNRGRHARAETPSVLKAATHIAVPSCLLSVSFRRFEITAHSEE